MLTKIQVNNFKSFKEAPAFPLAPVTILTGQNSSGKSTIIQSILVLKQTFENTSDESAVLFNGSLCALGDFRELFNRNAGGKKIIQFGLEFGGPCVDYLPKQRMRKNLASGLTKYVRSVALSISVDNKKNTEGTNVKKLSISGNIVNSNFNVTFSRDEKFQHDESEELIQPKVFRIIKSTGLEPKAIGSVLVDLLPRIIIVKAEEFEIQKAKFTRCFFTHLYNFFGRKPPISSDFILGLTSILVEDAHLRKPEEQAKRQAKNGKILKKIEGIIGRVEAFEAHYGRTVVENVLALMTTAQQEELLQKVLDEMKTTLSRKTDTKVKLQSIRDLKILFSAKDRIKLLQEKIFQEDSFVIVNSYIKQSFQNIWHLGPLREEPKAFYGRSSSADPTFVGQTGENVAFVLHHFGDKPIVCMAPEDKKDWDPYSASHSEQKLLLAVEKWLKYLGVAERVSSEDKGNVGLSIKANVYGDGLTDMTNVGVGISQVLPIVVMGLIAPYDAILLFEQPELHLHPFVQSRLSDFFISLSRIGKQVIAETHSEHIVHRLRFHIARGNARPDKDVGVYFFEHDKIDRSTIVKPVHINSYGVIEDWPKGFFDETTRQLDEILDAAICRTQSESAKRKEP